MDDLHDYDVYTLHRDDDCLIKNGTSTGSNARCVSNCTYRM